VLLTPNHSTYFSSNFRQRQMLDLYTNKYFISESGANYK